jgi:hypothetical protein
MMLVIEYIHLTLNTIQSLDFNEIVNKIKLTWAY